MQTRFKKNAKIFDIVITAVAGMFSVGIMLYGVLHFGLRQAWPELVLNIFYIACLVMIWMYFFNYRITTQQFNYWCSLSAGTTVVLRDILFPPALGVLLAAPDVSHPLRAAALHAHLLLCTEELAELHEAQPVGHLHRRYAHCRPLQPRHLP